MVVTGSRVITNGFAQPTPVTVLSMEQMRQTAPDSLSDAILQLPQFRSSFAPATSAFNPGSTSNAGASFVNLRGVGSSRGLTLLNGERVVPSSTGNGSAVDINVLPQQLVRRIDVVTGGASAAYGSDALSGVTNFILDTKFVGVKGEVRGGISTYGDNGNVGASIAAGHAFLGGRAHVIASYEYYRTQGIKNYGQGDRGWAESQVGVYANTAACPLPQTSTTCPTRIVTGPIFPAGFSSGGIITASTLTGPALTALGVPTATAPATPLTFIGGSAGNSNAGVTTVPFPFGTMRTNTTAATGQMLGGGIDRPFGQYLNFIPVTLRHTGYIRGEYDLTPNWNVHADALYGWSATKYFGQIPSNSGTGQLSPFVIAQDNPYLPANIAAALNAAPAPITAPNLYNPATGKFDGPRVNTISVSRINADFPVQQNFANHATLRVTLGIDGKFDALGTTWNTTGYYAHGRAMFTSSTYHNVLTTNLFNAVDAVRSPGGAGLAAAGTPICRSTITNPNDGCVPLNVIGQNTATKAALDYIQGGANIQGNSHSSQILKQDVVEFGIHGQPFSTWAGPVSVGGGGSYRREAVTSSADPISDSYTPAIVGTPAYRAGLTAPLTINGFPGGSVAGGVTGGAASPRGIKGTGWSNVNNGSGPPGSLNVKEAFVETLIPLLKDSSFGRSLDLNMAFRYADYQYGGGVKNWKVGVSYRPIDDIRIRTTLSRDVRAPSLSNLFAPNQITLAGGTDPFRLGTTGQAEAGGGGNSISAGNPNLKPETGTTFTIGTVLTPRFAPGLTLSVDYYQILIKDEINNLGIQTVINQCFTGNTSFCSLITRNADPASFGAGNTVGPIVQVFLPVLNSGYQKLGGLDIEASYVFPLSRVFEGRNDILSMRAVFNYQGKNAVFITGGTSVTNTVHTIAGGVIQGTGGNYDWGGNINFNYRNGPLTLNWQQRFINKSKILNNVSEDGVPNPINLLVNPSAGTAATLNGLLPATVPAYWYSDVSVNYKFGPNSRYEAFLTVQNLFDKDLPQLGSIFAPQGVIPTNNAVYQLTGREYTAGVRFHF